MPGHVGVGDKNTKKTKKEKYNNNNKRDLNIKK